MSTRLIKLKSKGVSNPRIQGLTAQQQLFVKHLVASKDFSPTKAAQEAGYKYPSQMGRSLLQQDTIRVAVGKALHDRIERLEWQGDDVLQTLRTVIDFDVTEFYDQAGNLSMESIKSQPPHVRKCITKITSKRKSFVNELGEKEYYNQIEVELMDKNQALHLALKHFGLLNDDLRTQVMDDETKRRLIIELMGQIAQSTRESGGHIVDGTLIAKKASEEGPNWKNVNENGDVEGVIDGNENVVDSGSVNVVRNDLYGEDRSVMDINDKRSVMMDDEYDENYVEEEGK